MQAMYRICVGMDGRVTGVEVMTGIPGGDDAVREQIRNTWIYKRQAYPVCTIRKFLFMFRGK
jgi:hypothetical protein